MTSSKFPLYLTDEEYRVVLKSLTITNNDYPHPTYSTTDYKAVHDKLKSQLEALGVKF